MVGHDESGLVEIASEGDADDDGVDDSVDVDAESGALSLALSESSWELWEQNSATQTPAVTCLANCQIDTKQHPPDSCKRQ